MISPSSAASCSREPVSRESSQSCCRGSRADRPSSQTFVERRLAGSDYMSFSRAGFPAAFATEADPMAGLFDPFVHTVADRMDLSTGEFSFEVGSQKASKRSV